MLEYEQTRFILLLVNITVFVYVIAAMHRKDMQVGIVPGMHKLTAMVYGGK